jgi:hypothetical protein
VRVVENRLRARRRRCRSAAVIASLPTGLRPRAMFRFRFYVTDGPFPVTKFEDKAGYFVTETRHPSRKFPWPGYAAGWGLPFPNVEKKLDAID